MRAPARRCPCITGSILAVALLACSGSAPPPGSRGAASRTLPAPPLTASPAAVAAAPDSAWSVQRYPRWGFSLRGPARGWRILGPPDAHCGTATDTLFDERGRTIPWDSLFEADLRVRFVPPPVDSALALEGFERSAHWPSGWMGLGRQGSRARAELIRRPRWWALAATVLAGVPIDSGGMALGEEARALAVVPRPDGCRMVAVLGGVLLDEPGTAVLTPPALRVLDGIRFKGEAGW